MSKYVLGYDSSVLVYDASVLYHIPDTDFPIDDLISYYRLSESALAQSNVAYDAFGTNDLVGGNFSNNGKRGNCYYCRAPLGELPSQVLYSPDSSVFDFGISDAFSFSFWFKRFSGATQEQPDNYIISKIRTSMDQGYSILFNEDKIAFYLIDNDGYNLTVIKNTAIPISYWYHFICSYDGSGSSSGLNLFVNADNTDLSRYNLGTPVNIRNNEKFIIGDVNLNLRDYSAKGFIDEVAVFNRALTQTDANIIYNAGAGKYY